MTAGPLEWAAQQCGLVLGGGDDRQQQRLAVMIVRELET